MRRVFKRELCLDVALTGVGLWPNGIPITTDYKDEDEFLGLLKNFSVRNIDVITFSSKPDKPDVVSRPIALYGIFECYSEIVVSGSAIEAMARRNNSASRSYS